MWKDMKPGRLQLRESRRKMVDDRQRLHDDLIEARCQVRMLREKVTELLGRLAETEATAASLRSAIKTSSCSLPMPKGRP